MPQAFSDFSKYNLSKYNCENIEQNSAIEFMFGFYLWNDPCRSVLQTKKNPLWKYLKVIVAFCTSKKHIWAYLERRVIRILLILSIVLLGLTSNKLNGVKLMRSHVLISCASRLTTHCPSYFDYFTSTYIVKKFHHSLIELIECCLHPVMYCSWFFK